MRLFLCEAPTRETRSDHNAGNYVLRYLSTAVICAEERIRSKTESFEEKIIMKSDPRLN